VGIQHVTNTLPCKRLIRNAEGDKDLQCDWANRKCTRNCDHYKYRIMYLIYTLIIRQGTT